ncbi:MAG: hypothetical protein D4R64_05070 [Porphyromonadaceae bacterium]|nr:MAG: hypothetical protein D4R64_05070 [Porphyromonadaceae bacterium]
MTAEKSSITSAELIKQLESKDPAVVLQTLNKLEKVGNINDLPSIIKVMAGVAEPRPLNDFTSFLSNIRSKQAPAILAQFLADPASAKIRVELVRSCWESQLDYSPHLILFAHLFIAGDYILALEAFTVIENTCLERPVQKGLLREISILIKNSLPDQPETKQRLVKELILVLDRTS